MLREVSMMLGRCDGATGVLSRAMANRRAVDIGALAVLGSFSLVLFLFHLDRRGLGSSHEARAGQHAQWMIDRSEWGMPRLYGGEADYQKPPLYYWLVALCARFGEVDAWAIRLPAALAATMGVWLTYVLGSSCARPFTGFIASLALATSLRYNYLARAGRIDMPLAVCVAATM